MAGALVPFAFVKAGSDTSDFHSLTRPTRAMTVREAWVYDQLAVDWAQLDGLTQKALYAQACMGRLAGQLREVFEKTATEVLEGLDHVSRQYGSRPGAVPKRDHLVGSADLPALMGYFDKALLESTATNSLRLKEAADHEIARIASRSLDPPGQARLAPPVIVKRGFWQRLLDATGNPALPPGG